MFTVEPENGNNEYVNDKVTPVEKVRVLGLGGQSLTAQQMNTIITSCFERELNMSLFENVQLKQTATPFTWNNIVDDCVFITPVKVNTSKGFTVQG